MTDSDLDVKVDGQLSGPLAAAAATRPPTPVRRAKFVFGRGLLARALGLPDTVRIVSMHVTHDPDIVHVIVEGDGVPEYGTSLGEHGDLAARGVVQSPVLPHPAEAFKLTWDGWVLGGPSLEMRLRGEPS